MCVVCWCVTFDRPSNSHELNKLRLLSFRRSSIGTFIRSHPSSDSSASSTKPKKEAPPKLDYRSMVSIDDMPALFVSFDSKLQTNQKNFSLLLAKFILCSMRKFTRNVVNNFLFCDNFSMSNSTLDGALLLRNKKLAAQKFSSFSFLFSVWMLEEKF